MLVGLVLVPVVSIMTTPPDKTLVDEAFASYDQKVMVPLRDDLGNT